MNFLLFFIGQLVSYGLLFLVNDYVGTLAAAIVGAIAFSVWVISWLTELIQRSKVSRLYYQFILSAWLAPLIAVMGWVLLRGRLDWMT